MAVFRLNPDNEFSVGRDAAVTTRGFADSAVIPADFSVVQQEQLEHAVMPLMHNAETSGVAIVLKGEDSPVVQRTSAHGTSNRTTTDIGSQRQSRF